VDTEGAGSMREHWWWRPGWRVGRSFYTWHFTFVGNPAVQGLARAHVDLLGALPMLDPVPGRWLHLTTQGVGFSDEVSDSDVDRIVDAAGVRCAALAPVTVTLGPADMDPEGVFLPVIPLTPLASVRHTLREAIAEVWSADRVPEPEDAYHPHVTLGYSNSSGPAGPIRTALAGHELPSVEVTISTVSLLDLNRDNRQYQWTTVAELPLGA
jgi:2'-5' RNA ligase